MVIAARISRAAGRLCHDGRAGHRSSLRCSRGSRQTGSGSRLGPHLGYVFVNLGYSFLAAAAGGYVTAWIAAANPLVHVLVLGIIVLALAALSALQSKGQAARLRTSSRSLRSRRSACSPEASSASGCWESSSAAYLLPILPEPSRNLPDSIRWGTFAFAAARSTNARQPLPE